MQTPPPRPPRARLAGALYLTIIVAAMAAEVFVRGRLIVSGDATATANRILAAPLLYRAGTALDLLVLFCDAGLALLIYRLLKPVNEDAALLAAFFRLIWVAVMMTGEVFFFSALTLLKGGGSLALLDEGQRQTLAAVDLRLYHIGYDLGLVFFGAHCVIVGALIVRSILIPRLVGILMIVAGSCYIINSVNNMLPAELSAPLFPYILLPGLVGEGALTLWLLFRGVSASKWNEQVRLSA